MSVEITGAGAPGPTRTSAENSVKAMRCDPRLGEKTKSLIENQTAKDVMRGSKCGGLTPELSCEPDGLDTKRLMRAAGGRHDSGREALVSFSVR